VRVPSFSKRSVGASGADPLSGTTLLRPAMTAIAANRNNGFIISCSCTQFSLYYKHNRLDTTVVPVEPGLGAYIQRISTARWELIDVFDDLPVEFEPGERFKYNNSGYVLLGAIIESVSGMTYADFVQERIFDRLGMKDSYYGSHSRIIPRRAPGHSGEPGAWIHAAFLSMTQPYSAGALMMTVEDLFRWNQGLYGGELISEGSLERMTTPYVLNNGNATGYGYGLAPRDLRGRRAIGHGGGINGYVTDAFYLPEEDLFVAVFSNSPGSLAGPNLVAGKLGAIAIGDPYPVWKEIALDEATLRHFAGVYEIDENTQRVVTVEDGQLYTQRTGSQKLRAFPSSETRFFYKHSLSHFEFVIEGGETYMLMYQGGADEAERAVKVSGAP
jgi:CubicO group peptidase (beta-lactamase class C family)